MNDREKNQGLRISAILPAYNEQDNLTGVVRALIATLELNAAEFEVIVVDDGSRDNTRGIANDLAAQDQRVRVIFHESNLGYGRALRSGFEAVKMDWIFFTDADGQFEPAEIKKLIELASGRDFVSGYRSKRADPWHRRLYGYTFSIIVRTMFGVRARDINCAFKLFKKELIRDHEFITQGALINAELLIAARKKGVDPEEAPVTHKPRVSGSQSGGSVRVIFRAMGEIMKLWMKN